MVKNLVFSKKKYIFAQIGNNMTKLLRIAYIKDHSIEEIVDSHVKYVTKPTIELDFIEEDDETKRFPSMKFVERIVEDNQNPVPRAFTLYTKYEFLIHTIISRCRARDGECTLDYDYFRNLLGKQYGNMLHNLQLMQIINISSVFEIGKSSRIISLLDWEIGFKSVNNLKLLEFSDKLKDYIKKLESKKKNEHIGILGRKLYYDYVSNLSKIELVKKDEVIEFLENYPFSSLKQKSCYYDNIENYEKRKGSISSIDYRGRIYNVLTNCPRVLRRFFNLKLDVDIANSQPLLFCNFLIKKFRIKHDIIKELSLIDIELFNNKISKDYNKGQLLRGQLKNNGLQVPNCADLPTDILLYIYTCMKGIFWDNFVSIFFDTLERAEVKENLFREVFYSYSTTMRHKEFGKIFAQIYPNVWKVIRSMKKEETKLWDAITKVESKLFHSILKQCYKRGWAVTSIHDAIIVLNVPENKGFNVDDLKNIILKEYGKIGLFPTLHVDYFHEEKDETMELIEEFSKPL